VPSDKAAIQSVTPSQMYGWEGLGPDVELTATTEDRMPSEQKWFALIDRVVAVKVEADGDLRLRCKMRPTTNPALWSAKSQQNSVVFDSPEGFWLDADFRWSFENTIKKHDGLSLYVVPILKSMAGTSVRARRLSNQKCFVRRPNCTQCRCQDFVLL